MKHRYGLLTKLFESDNVGDLESCIGTFSRTHEVTDVKITTYQNDLRHTGLRSADFCTSFVAVVMYRVDFSVMDMQDEIDDWVDARTKEIMADEERHAKRIGATDLAIPPPRTEIRIERTRKQVLESDEYKAFVDTMRIKYEEDRLA